jgi:hypothetical protein
MLLFPFLGLFLSLAIWGTFYPVPGFIHMVAKLNRRNSCRWRELAEKDVVAASDTRDVGLKTWIDNSRINNHAVKWFGLIGG